MKKLKIKNNPKVKSVFAKYPVPVRKKMLAMRELIIETAKETDQVSSLEETLKWGEPSYLTPIGSTVRIDWKEKTPDQYAMYFQCTSRLVETFKLVFGSKFQYEGNRAIIFKMNKKIPVEELKACIQAALTYHKVKNLQTLGI
jgi:hypothetical protein